MKKDIYFILYIKLTLNRSHVYDSYNADIYIYKLHEMLRRKILMSLEQAKVSGKNEKPEIPRKYIKFIKNLKLLPFGKTW